MSAMLSFLRAHSCSHRALSNTTRSCRTLRSYTTVDAPNERFSLPPHDQWRTVFPVYIAHIRDRVSLANEHTAKKLAKSFLTGPHVPKGKGKIVIEAFPGPGTLSRALMELPSTVMEKLIILENFEPYLEYLRPLEKIDPRVSVVPMSGFDWNTYEYLQENGYFSELETVPWEDGVHPQLHFISHIPHDVKGEQLVAQFFRAIPERVWLYKFGRVPMSLILGEWLWERVTAGPGERARCKVGVIAQAAAELREALSPKVLLPYDDHFHPRTVKNYLQEHKPESRRLGHPLTAVNIIPHEKQIIEKGLLDKWDFVLRRLFVLKSTPLKKAIVSLSAGAVTLNKMLTDPQLPPEEHVDLSKSPRKLTLDEWALVLRAFDNWPFAPEDLYISDAFTRVRD